MKYLSIAIMVGFSALLMSGPSCFAHDYSAQGVLTRSETRAYRACLFQAWIEDYCHENSLKLTASYDRVYTSCVAANGGWRFPLAGRSWLNTDDYCWAAAHRVVGVR
jgi:hypothetical protein